MARLDIKVNRNLRDHAEKVYKELGMSLESAVNMFLKQSVLDNGLPFKSTVSKSVNPADDYVIRTSNGHEDVMDYLNNTKQDINNDKLARNLLDNNYNKLASWAKSSIMNGKARYLSSTKGIRLRGVSVISTDMDKYFSKKDQSEFRDWYVKHLLNDGKANQQDLKRVTGAVKGVEAQCMLSDYVALKMLRCDDNVLRKTFSFLN